jgi:membrane protease subunit (stomatin/prohibitin family)
VGLGAGMLMAGQMMSALKGDKGGQEPPPSATPAGEARFCINCGKPIPGKAKFCPECGTSQQ